MNFFKLLVQNSLGILNLKLVRIPSYVMPEIPFDLFECVLIKVLLETRSSFRFIQVRANDSRVDDEFSSLIRRYKMTGCLVEYSPYVFEQLRLNYSDQPQITVSKIVLNTKKSTTENKKFKSKKSAIADFFQRIVLRFSSSNLRLDSPINNLKKIENNECITHNLNKIYEDLNYDNLHLLYLKSNNYNDELIYQVLNEKLYPLIINYEWTEMDSRQNYQLKMRLLDEGYRFINVGSETLCVRQYN